MADTRQPQASHGALTGESLNRQLTTNQNAPDASTHTLKP